MFLNGTASGFSGVSSPEVSLLLVERGLARSESMTLDLRFGLIISAHQGIRSVRMNVIVRIAVNKYRPHGTMQLKKQKK